MNLVSYKQWPGSPESEGLYTSTLWIKESPPRYGRHQYNRKGLQFPVGIKIFTYELIGLWLHNRQDSTGKTISIGNGKSTFFQGSNINLFLR